MSQAMTPQLQDRHYLPMADDFVEEALANYNTGEFTQQLATTPHGRGYHIRPHGQGVHDTAIRNRTTLLEADVPESEVPSMFITRTAAATHDEAFFTFFSDQHIRSRFKNPEEYAMYLYAERARSPKYRGIDEATIAEGQDVIRTTRVAERCMSWGQLIVCEADIHSTTLDDTSRMDEDTEILFEEYRITNSDITKLGYDLLSLGVLTAIKTVNLNFPRLNQVEYFYERREQMGRNLENRAQSIMNRASNLGIIKASIDTVLPEFIRPYTRKIMRIEQAA